MKNKYTIELKKIQQQYFDLIKSADITENDPEFYFKAVALIDKCEAFWLSKKIQLSIILDELTKNQKCFLLSGAIYLDVDGNGHYTFGALGDLNILNDPIVRMRGFFAKGLEGINENTKTYFWDALSDTLKIIDQYPNEFLFISIDILYDSVRKENLELIDKIYWDLISDIVNKEIRSIKNLTKAFATIDDIEKSIPKEKLDRLIFNDDSDVELSLKNRLEKYFNNSQIPLNLSIQNDIARFYFATFSQIQQAVEIIFKCLQFNLIPFIRYEVTIKYFMLIGSAFSKDLDLKETIDYSIIGYLYSAYIETEEVYKIDFKTFFNKCKEQQFIKSIYNKLTNDGNDMHAMHVTEVLDEINNTFTSLIL